MHKTDDSTIRGELPQGQDGPHRIYPFLVVVSGDSVGEMFRLAGRMTIGRADDAEIRLDDERVSRHHARVEVRADGKVDLSDLESRNGTFRNGERIVVCTLEDGDKIQVGSKTVLKFIYQDEREEAWQKNLYLSATRDWLTRTHNRKYFSEALEKEFAFAQRHGTPLTLLIIDSDHFKQINDAHGHAAGDRVLAQLATRLRKCLRTEDLIARYGGEEFAVLLRDTSVTQGSACAKRLRRAVAELAFKYHDEPIEATISIGVATFKPGSYESAEQLFEAADQMLYRAKQAGRNRVATATRAP
jgi:two-component system cell cycle response regulator